MMVKQISSGIEAGRVPAKRKRAQPRRKVPFTSRSTPEKKDQTLATMKNTEPA